MIEKKERMRARKVVFAVLTLLLFSPVVQSQAMLTKAEAIHLVEYKLKELNGGRFKAASCTVKDESCTVVGTNGVYDLEAQLDALAARVLRISRDGELIYKWEGVKIVGHRGNVKFAPENTIPAMLMAVELGADLVEIDVRETRDGELVLMHDETVDRTTDGFGKVNEFLLADIKTLDAGSWFDEKFAGVRVPTVREVLAAIRGKALPDIDFKAGDPEKLIKVLQEEGLLGKATLYCSDWDLMQRTSNLTPEGFLLRPTAPGGLQGLPIVLNEFDPAIININWEEFNENLVRAVHVAGKKSFLNAMQQDTDYVREMMMRTLPDYLQSDHVDLLAPLLRERGLHK